MDDLDATVAEMDRLLNEISKAEERIASAIRLIKIIKALYPGLQHWPPGEATPRNMFH
jgi:hypothetical protein